VLPASRRQIGWSPVLLMDRRMPVRALAWPKDSLAEPLPVWRSRRTSSPLWTGMIYGPAAVVRRLLRSADVGVMQPLGPILLMTFLAP